jgi:hypothetical protein
MPGRILAGPPSRSTAVGREQMGRADGTPDEDLGFFTPPSTCDDALAKQGGKDIGSVGDPIIDLP